jgi:hypothetical protein
MAASSAAGSFMAVQLGGELLWIEQQHGTAAHLAFSVTSPGRLRRQRKQETGLVPSRQDAGKPRGWYELLSANVRCWHFADIPLAILDVRF